MAMGGKLSFLVFRGKVIGSIMRETTELLAPYPTRPLQGLEGQVEILRQDVYWWVWPYENRICQLGLLQEPQRDSVSDTGSAHCAS